MKFKNLFTLFFLFVGLGALSAQDDCDCPDTDWDTEGICIEVVEDGETIVGWMPDECYAECFFGEDYTVVECEDWEWEDECECDDDEWNNDGICVEVTYEGETYTEWAPSECYAACWFEDGYTVVECEDWEWEEECECDEDDWNNDGICVEVTYEGETYIQWAPSECYAACWFEDGYTVVECDDWEWEDECECDEDAWNTDGICIEVNYEGEIFTEWVPSECYAACWYEEGYTVIDCPEGGFGGGECDWGLDCDCEIDSDEGICIAYIYTDSIFGITDTLIEWVPNECFADCWGFTDYSVVDCESFWDWEEEDNGTEITIEGDAECIIELLETEELTFQTFLYGLADCEAIELDDCVLNAPIFDNDEDFINYLVDNCPEWFGLIMDESEGPSLFNRFIEAQDGAEVTSTNEIEGLSVALLGNPISDQLNVSINTAEAIDLQVVLTSVTGKVLNMENVRFGKGEQIYTVNTVQLSAGIYNMTMSSNKATQTIKFVVVK